ncbi:MAG: thioredoxin [Gracilibacter sp. BRH_c7a]|nr:MAG: thioredoxin [Gracilibacter sp. BRH_c7a]
MASNPSKSPWIRMMVPIFIVVVIVGIWYMKNQPTESEIDSNQSQLSAGVADSNSDFSLLVTKEIDMEKLKSYGIPIIIDFGADSCIPCKEMAPVLKELNEELQGKAIIRFVDVWKFPDLAKGYPISVIPTQVFIDAKGKPYTPEDPNTLPLKKYNAKTTNEHVFTTHEGGMTKEQLLAVLKEMGVE